MFGIHNLECPVLVRVKGDLQAFPGSWIVSCKEITAKAGGLSNLSDFL